MGAPTADFSGTLDDDASRLTRPQGDSDQRRALREAFLGRHAEAVYEALTDGYRKEVRVEQLVFLAAERFPGLVPTRAEMEAERQLRQAEKAGHELDQGNLLAHLLARPRPGTHLAHVMLRPRPEARERLEEFCSTGRADLGLARVERAGRNGQVELANPRFLNAEDDGATAALEIAVDLVLLDPACEVGVLRGAVVDHPRHAGRRVFNAGINLTHLYHGRISLVNFMIAREMGLLGKVQRGLWLSDDWDSGLEDTAEKPWIAAVESFAIGGGCQLLLVMDRVIAARGAYFSLPARKEGIVPGNANQRLARFVGERVARQAILFERSFPVDDPASIGLCDRVVEESAMDAAIAEDAEQLTSSGLAAVAANRKLLRLGQEPIDQFRRYMAVYAREQARCLYAPALISNLERNWRAAERTP
ncbi:MAG TPA: enoyl-CoA hydratase/isomerase family protein [Candidatus Dormibacteraeota bacterium]|nr:enoyl-CoA hydratase/isomerase family protein [Candidatus Dormibacteraeota bacterium]